MDFYLFSPQSKLVFNQQEVFLSMTLFSAIHELPRTGKRKLDFEYGRTRGVNFQQMRALSASFGCFYKHSENQNGQAKKIIDS